MAKQKTYQPKGDTPSASTKAKPRDGFTQLMLERAEDAFQFDTEQRRRCVEDMRFAFESGKQWDPHLTYKRRNKPNYEFNRIRQLIRRITGQQLKNKPNIKVRAVEDNDKDVADIYNGLIKNIEVQSSAENAYDTAFQWACGGGYGVIRVIADYEPGDSFDQRLIIKNVMDPMTCFCDPSAREFDRSDARFWFITELIPRSEFKKRWPKLQPIDFDVTSATDSYDREWFNEDEVRIAEYWYTEPETKTIYMLSDGSVVNADEFDLIKDEMAHPPTDPQTGQPQWQPVTIKEGADGKPMIREVETNAVYSCLVYGAGQLEPPTKWGGTMIPIVPQWGDLVVIEGKQIYSGMTRFGRDSQMIHNFEMSTLVEVVAKLPNSPLRATPAMIKGLESYYERMGYDDAPVLLYNHDPQAPGGAPSREPLAQMPAALGQLAAIAGDELKATLGVYDASLGAQSNETSGRAIMARNNQADTANFVYIDNQVKTLKRVGEVLVDAIPHYYDAERTIRILGEDMAEEYVKVNHPVIGEDGQLHVENDLTRGRFDVVCTVGKSYDTARMELADLGQTLAQTPGPIGAIGQFLLFKSLDVPGIDMYVQAVRQQLVNDGTLPPGEGDQPPPPPQPDPVKMAQAQHHIEQAQLAKARAQDIQAKQQSEIQKNEADAAEKISQIPGHEADSHQTMIQNAQALAPLTPMGTVIPHENPLQVNTGDYQGGF
jgi:hypothetical protein